ncbi:hypothetical protein DSO57_1036735 [Entomophthora muscae]|uniref:Uncharacterized protein n=1 Tax=Entomophthora muscae TaxID=34485 RepID=A0ACC2T9V6_9FUNG|nr:hypothetical protein DSO57_1036735 [Entomophthora muscae]
MCDISSSLSTTSFREDSSCLLYVLDDLPGRACSVLASSSVCLQNLAPDNEDLSLSQGMPSPPSSQVTLASMSEIVNEVPLLEASCCVLRRNTDTQ